MTSQTHASPTRPAAGPAGPIFVRWTGHGGRWWAGVLALWTALALLVALQTGLATLYRGQPVVWSRVIGVRLLDWATCALFLPVLVGLARHLPLQRGVLGRHLALQAGSAAVVVLLKQVILHLLLQAWLPAHSASLMQELATTGINEFIIFCAIIGVIHATEYHRRYEERGRDAAELERQLTESRLATLTSQIRPHFLFNTMHGITTLMRSDPDAAEHMMSQLADLLEGSLKHPPSHLVALRDEIRLVGKYLAIMQMRFGTRLRVDIAVPDELLDATVPVFLLQPLVENAIEHGVATRAGPASVRLTAERLGDTLRLTVADDGAGAPVADGNGRRSGGIGLANTHQRLKALYGASCNIELRRDIERGTTMTVELPFRTESSAQPSTA